MESIDSDYAPSDDLKSVSTSNGSFESSEDETKSAIHEEILMRSQRLNWVVDLQMLPPLDGQ